MEMVRSSKHVTGSEQTPGHCREGQRLLLGNSPKALNLLQEAVWRVFSTGLRRFAVVTQGILAMQYPRDILPNIVSLKNLQEITWETTVFSRIPL